MEAGASLRNVCVHVYVCLIIYIKTNQIALIVF